GGGGGAGGGSSYVNPDYGQAVSFTTALGLGDGQVILTWQQPVATVTLNASSPSVVSGQPTTFTVTVSASDSNTPLPTGSVTLADIHKQGDSYVTDHLGTATLSGTSPDQAVFTITQLPLGATTVQANYSGDGFYLAALTSIVESGVAPTPTPMPV